MDRDLDGHMFGHDRGAIGGGKGSFNSLVTHMIIFAIRIVPVAVIRDSQPQCFSVLLFEINFVVILWIHIFAECNCNFNFCASVEAAAAFKHW